MMKLDPKVGLRREILLSIEDVGSLTAQLKEENFECLLDWQKIVDADNNYINELWDALLDSDWNDYLNDLCSEFRSSGTPTGLPERKNHRWLESTEVARKMTGADIWIAWTYWHGGGKYDEPENMPWIEDAYYLTAHTEMREVLVFKAA